MRNSRKIPSRWTLTGLTGQRALDPETSNVLAWPAPGLSRLSPLLAGLSPTRDHNMELLAGITSLPQTTASQQPVFSVFAADPFIRGKRIGPALRTKGYRRIVNWPTTAQYGHELITTLDSVNLGPAQERETLRYLGEQGLSISVAIVFPESVESFMVLKPELMFLTPDFGLWKDGCLDGTTLLKRCREVSRRIGKDVPIILMTDRKSISLRQAKQHGATAILVG